MKYMVKTIHLFWFLLLMAAALQGTAFCVLAQGTTVPPGALPEELKDLVIKENYVSSSFRKAGVIHALTGSVVVMHRATKEAYFGKEGDVIHENDSLRTLPESRCRIKLFNEDIITMAPDTDFFLEEYQDQKEEGKKSSLFSMAKGKAMFYAMRLFSYKESRFRVKTPTAVVGVRGTKFGVHVFLEEEMMSGIGIRVANRGREIGPYLAQAGTGSGEKVVTIVAAGDGQVTANEKIVNPGEVFDTRTDMVTYDPAALDRIEADASIQPRAAVSPPGEVTERETEEEEETETEESDQETAADQTETPQETAGQQTGSATETEAASTTGPTQYLGYFSGILLAQSSGDYPEEVYVSKERQDFDAADNVRAHGLIFPETDYAEARGVPTVYQNPYQKEVIYYSNSSGDLGTSRQVEEVRMDFNSYQEWGYWTQESTFTIQSHPYYFKDKGYYIYGNATPDASMSGFSGSAAYSGSAWGTYREWTDTSTTASADMTGIFTCNVNFGSASVTNFTVNVSGSGHSASISGADGSFTSSQFQINTSTGSWTIDHNSVTYRAANGSLYGPNGEYAGGAFGMQCTGTPPSLPAKAVQGIFQGSKSSSQTE